MRLNSTKTKRKIMDMEYGTPFDFSEKTVRASFIRKVYSILFCQLLVTIGIIAVFTFNEKVKDYFQHHAWLLYIAIAINIVCLICMACCTEVRRTAPMNFIFLAIFTLTLSFCLGGVAATYKSHEVMISLGMCGIVVFCLTAFAFQTKVDFTKWGGALFACLIIFIIFGILAFFIHGRTFQLFMAALGACLFSFFIVYDTQLMMGGKHKYSISPEEYIFAALNLYLDIVNLFLYILQMVGSSNN